MTVRWSEAALRHIAAIHAYIALDSPFYAARMADRILTRGDALASFPRVGRRVSDIEIAGLHEVIEPPYRIIYRVDDDIVHVLAVVHTARLLKRDDLR